MPLHTMYEKQITDRRIDVARCGVPTREALANAATVCKRLGAVNRVLLVFTDNKKSPEALACVVFSLVNGTTLVADVNARGEFVRLTRYAVNTRKRLPRDFMYEIAGEVYDNNGDPHYDAYHTKVYARNACCYYYNN